MYVVPKIKSKGPIGPYLVLVGDHLRSPAQVNKHKEELQKTDEYKVMRNSEIEWSSGLAAVSEPARCCSGWPDNASH